MNFSNIFIVQQVANVRMNVHFPVYRILYTEYVESNRGL